MLSSLIYSAVVKKSSECVASLWGRGAMVRLSANQKKRGHKIEKYEDGALGSATKWVSE